MKLVVFDYLYVDADNYKRANCVLLPNDAETAIGIDEACARIREACEDGEDFIADQVGLPEVFNWDPTADYDPDDQATWPEDLGPGRYVINEADHCFHTFGDIRPLGHRSEHSSLQLMTFSLKELVEKFEAESGKGWNTFEPKARWATASKKVSAGK